MAIADYEPYRQDVIYKDKVVMRVRGLSLDDVVILVRTHMDDLTALTALARAEKSDFINTSFFMTALSAAPNAIFSALALAADEIDQVNAIRNLPMGLQAKAAQTVMELTLEDIGGPKAAVALVRKLLDTPKQLTELTATSSSNGSESSGGR